MNKSINTAMQSALSAGTLVLEALRFPQVALEIAQQPQRVAVERGLTRDSVGACYTIIQGGKSEKAGVWL